MRPELTSDLPVRMARLPLDERGYPVPWFVEWVDGKPDFRLMDGAKWRRAVKEKLCWVCGQKLGSYLTFVIGPMCAVSRTTSEPACHRECARWSAKNCPFLVRPHMTRRGQEEIAARGAKPMGGEAIMRNPGVALLWTTRDFETWRPESGGVLITLGDPLAVEWWAEGRPATRAEVEESIRTGLPLLEATCDGDRAGAREALAKRAEEARELWPEE